MAYVECKDCGNSFHLAQRIGSQPDVRCFYCWQFARQPWRLRGLAAVAALLWGCAAPQPAPHALGAHAPAAHCHARGDLPDPDCTPGDVETTDLKIICGQSTKERRDVTEATKHAVEDAYGELHTAPEGTREVDHLVSIELGGSGDPKNLWPQPAPQFKEKDRLENEVHRAVCNGDLDIRDAQREIARDWRALERRLER